MENHHLGDDNRRRYVILELTVRFNYFLYESASRAANQSRLLVVHIVVDFPNPGAIHGMVAAKHVLPTGSKRRLKLSGCRILSLGVHDCPRPARLRERVREDWRERDV